MENLETSKSFRFVEVDVMKGIAIILVVLGHVLAWFYDDFLERFDTMPYNAIVLWKFQFLPKVSKGCEPFAKVLWNREYWRRSRRSKGSR